MKRTVVVTGMGTVNPLGSTVAEFWEATKRADNGIGPLTRFDTSLFPCRIAGQVKEFDASSVVDRKELRRMDPFTVYAVYAAAEALKDSGILGHVDPTRIGCVVGNGIGGFKSLGDNFAKLTERGPKGIHPLFIPMIITNIAPASIAIQFDLRGPNFAIATACASGTDAIGNALRWVQDGVVDAMVTGGTEAPLVPLGLGGFCSIQAVTTKHNDDPAHASRPFDRDRSGFVMGEGAGILVVEELEHAKRRGARIHGVVAGYGATCDANHLTAPHPEGVGAMAAMRAALASAEMKPEEVDYVNAHGTSTELNDRVETMAIQKVFGEHAKRLKVSSTKSMTGHLLGAAGGVEAIASIIALREQYYPPTRNWENREDGMELDYVPGTGVSGPMRAAISNSLGFGGHNGVLAFRRYVG
jgi:3-oxoacyl-[acyl-carrier-protein] synthase II